MQHGLRLLVAAAHPDDETLGFGGALARYASEGVETHLVTATRGQGGRYRGLASGSAEHPGPPSWEGFANGSCEQPPALWESRASLCSTTKISISIGWTPPKP